MKKASFSGPGVGLRLRVPALWALLWALGILVATLSPKQDVPSWPWADRIQLDKWVHAFLFGMQCVLLGLAFLRASSVNRPVGLLVLATVLAVAFGGVVELLQEVMGNGREGDVSDLLADAAGALLGLAWLWRRR